VQNGGEATRSKISPGPEARRDEIKRHLIENESQQTEVIGYISQLSIQLHRWQLRLQTLNERKAQLEAELHKLPKS
jgi:predicted nuclease with TOPRIM domain